MVFNNVEINLVQDAISVNSCWCRGYGWRSRCHHSCTGNCTTKRLKLEGSAVPGATIEKAASILISGFIMFRSGQAYYVRLIRYC